MLLDGSLGWLVLDWQILSEGMSFLGVSMRCGELL